MLYVATEDELSEAVVERLLSYVNCGLEIGVRMGRQGNGYLRNKLPGLVTLSQSIPVVMLTDLDRIVCAPALLNDWFRGNGVPPNFLFRIAVREVEAWLLADNEAFETFAKVPARKIPEDPSILQDAKLTLLNLIRKYASREVKGALLPTGKGSAKVGIGYNAMLVRYVRELWQPHRAANRSESLAKAILRLRAL